MNLRELSSRWLPALLILVAAAWTFGRYGDQEELFHDHGIILYAGQQVVAGQPPYVGIFDHKGPGAALVCAAGVQLARAVGTDDVRGVRFLFLWISAGVVAALFLLARRLFGSPWPGLIAAATFLGYWNFAITAYSGPEPKTPMVLFQVLALLWAAERRWFAAGLASAGAFLVWQPMAVVGLVVLAGAAAQGGARKALAALFGGLLPVALVAIYYAAHGALYELIDGVALFNLTLMENAASTYTNVRAVQQAMLLSFKPAGLVLAVGLFAMVPLWLWRWKRSRGAEFLRDPFFCLLVTLPAPLLWSVLDFQGGPDFFVFLPYAALGFGWLTWLGLVRVWELTELGGAGRAAVGALAVASLWSSAWILMDAKAPARLGDQRRMLAAFEQRHAGKRIATVGAPQALVLLERPNLTRYGFMMRGISNHVEARFPGGFEGWLASLEDEVEVLITTEMAAFEMGAHAERWRTWLEEHYTRDEAAYGKLEVWLRRAAVRSQDD